jgi:host factor-I protein
MKEIDSVAVKRAPAPDEQEEFTSRKLIRPTLPRPEHGRPEQRSEPLTANAERRQARKASPAVEQTHAENFYYQKQMQTRTPLVVVLRGGEQMEGVIEWYDRDSIKLSRSNGSPVLVYKGSIRYLFKAQENH